MKKVLLFLALAFTVPFACEQAGGVEITLEYLMRENEALKMRMAELEATQAREMRELMMRFSDLEKKVNNKSQRDVPGNTQKGSSKSPYLFGIPKVVLVEQTITEVETGKTKGWVPHPPNLPVMAEPSDLAIKPYGTLIVQGVPNPNIGENGRMDASYNANIDFEKQLGDWGLAFLELEMDQGSGVIERINVFSNVNNNAEEGWRVLVNKVWYEQYLFNKQLAVNAGKLDATDWVDQNKYANDDTYQFLGDMFNNSPVIEWPIENGLGAHMRIQPENVKCLVFDFSYFDSIGQWRDIADYGLYMAQVNIKPSEILEFDSAQWGGNYRFYTWLNSRNHVKLMSPTDTGEHNYGYGLSIDQMLTDAFGVFARVGWQRPDIIPASGGPTLDLSWSAGGQAEGRLWGREYDALGVAVGQIFPSEDYRNAGFPGETEGHFELYYKYQLNKNLAISPDFQLIWNPNGEDNDDDTICVYGVRSHLNF